MQIKLKAFTKSTINSGMKTVETGLIISYDYKMKQKK